MNICLRMMSALVMITCLAGGRAAAMNVTGTIPSMWAGELNWYLSCPAYATDPLGGHRYGLSDSLGEPMEHPSVIDFPGGAYKYLAVYHTPYPRSDGSYYQVKLAASNDLLNWTYIRTLFNNADQPKMILANGGQWVIVIHEQFFELSGGGSTWGRSRVKCEQFDNATALYNGTLLNSYTCPQYSSTGCDGTPNFYVCSEYLHSDGMWAIDAVIGFCGWNGTKDNVCQATILNMFDPNNNVVWSPDWATNYDNLFANMGVTGNLGDRDSIVISDGRFNIQEGNLGVPGGSWDQWRIFLYQYAHGEPAWPTGAGSAQQLGPVLDGGAVSLGNPCVSLVQSPTLSGHQALVAAYFVFYPGNGTTPCGQAIWYYNLDNNIIANGGGDFADGSGNWPVNWNRVNAPVWATDAYKSASHSFKINGGTDSEWFSKAYPLRGVSQVNASLWWKYTNMNGGFNAGLRFYSGIDSNGNGTGYISQQTLTPGTGSVDWTQVSLGNISIPSGANYCDFDFWGRGGMASESSIYIDDASVLKAN